jgi:hypothetical protein
VRQPRVPHIPRCLHCGSAAPDDPRRVHTRQGDTTGWLCGPPCAAAYFRAQEPLAAETAPSAPHPTPAENEPRVSIEVRSAGFPAGVAGTKVTGCEIAAPGHSKAPGNETRVSIEENGTCQSRHPLRTVISGRDEKSRGDRSQICASHAPPTMKGEGVSHSRPMLTHMGAGGEGVLGLPDHSLNPPTAAPGEPDPRPQNETRVSIGENETRDSVGESETKIAIEEIETRASIVPPEPPARPNRESGSPKSTRPRAAGGRARSSQPGRGPSRRERRARAAQR